MTHHDNHHNHPEPDGHGQPNQSDHEHHDHMTPASHHDHDHSGHTGHDHSGHGGHMAHANQFRDLFWINLILTIPVVFSSHMIMEWFNYSLPDWPGVSWIAPVLGTVIFFYGGRVFIDGAISELKARQPGMMTLISMAITVAFLASWATTIGWLELDFWWELALLVTIMLLGHWLEMRALGASQNALQSLAELLPDDAERIVGDHTELVPVSELHEDDIVLVRPGGRVAADGQIVEGEADFDESLLTGESQPVSHTVGDLVIAGAVVSGSSVRYRVTASGENTVLAGIQRMVAEAQSSKTGTQVLADKFAALLFYVTSAAALITFFVWWLWADDLNGAITRAVTLLIIACPHALGLAIPLVVAITTEVGARNGVLIRDRTQLEEFRNVSTVLWDKTGTLTRGEHVVRDVIAVDGDVDQLLAHAAAVERDSEHPLAKAIFTAATEKSLEIPRAENFTAKAGRGVGADIDGQSWIIGGPRALRESGADISDEMAAWRDDWSARGGSVLYALSGNQVRGAIATADDIRAESVQAIAELTVDGVKSVMITGDAQPIADAVASEIGIDEVRAEVLPEHKQDFVREAKGNGETVAMVGDGVNDAPALALADVGLAIGAGTDVAMQTSGIILAGSDPRAVPGTRRLSVAMYKKMIQNLLWAAGYNLFAIPLAAGVLAPWGITMPPAVAAIAMSLSTIVVALNAQTLRRFKLIPE